MPAKNKKKKRETNSYQVDYLTLKWVVPTSAARSQQIPVCRLHTSYITTQTKTLQHKNRADATTHIILRGLIKFDSQLLSSFNLSPSVYVITDQWKATTDVSVI